jgi:hypothetical protein
MIRRGW